jgi:protein tyrosine/serine phosphatase
MIASPLIEESRSEPRKALTSRMPVRIRRLFIILVVLLAAGSIGYELSENFHTVVAGQVYRSGQLSPSSLTSHIARRHIRSIINLRGANRGDAWYEQERAVARQQGLPHYDLPLDSLTPPTGADLRQLIALLDECPKPVLIHCQSGIDRSGMVAAICILLYDDEGSTEAALSQLSWRFGHLPWQENAVRLKAFMDCYEAWLAQQGCGHSRAAFRQWAAVQ